MLSIFCLLRSLFLIGFLPPLSAIPAVFAEGFIGFLLSEVIPLQDKIENEEGEKTLAIVREKYSTLLCW